VEFTKHPIFGVEVPASVANVPTEILEPRNTWTDKEAYDKTAASLAEKFVSNFKKYADFANEEILAGAPKVAVEAGV
jgi:phosphoenolpyruvate carboxykinase (ATP)